MTADAMPDEGELTAAGLRLDADGSVLTIWLARPGVRNAQTPAMWRALARIGAAVPPGVRVVVLRGEGASFSAGLDRAMFEPGAISGDPGLVSLAQGSDSELDDAIARYQEAFTWWRSPAFVSVAVVQGHAVGAGFQLALACDLRILADDAQLAMRETALGLVPDLGGTQPLVQAVGYGRALEICATGRWVSATEAAQVGLANIVVPVASLDATAADLVEALTAPAHGAVTALKGLPLAAGERSYGDQLAAERTTQAGLLRDLVRALE